MAQIRLINDMSRVKLWVVTVLATPAAADVFAAHLGETALAVSTLSPPRRNTAPIEAIFDAPPDTACLTAQLSVLAVINGLPPPKIKMAEMPGLDWLKKVTEDFPPLRIARWTVHGAQHAHAVPNRRWALQIDATSAFGTGEHPTTRGCLLMLDWILKKRRSGRRMLDMGCGSGILAMGYAKATHGQATAVDNDPDSIIVAAHNVRANGLQRYVRSALGRGYHSLFVRRHAPYDLIMSNIFARPLSHMAKDLKLHLRPGGVAILSGILARQANMVIAAHRMQELYLVRHMKIGDWSVLALKRRHQNFFGATE